jgi:catechol 2,3-dioxygenase-like lactoylglutathione lyase family enzyme
MAVLGYACVGTNDFDRALAFYDQFLGAMGGKRLMPTPAGVLYGLEAGAAVMIVRPHDGQEAHPGNGTMLAFRVAEQAEVSALHRLALSLGATCAGLPGPRGSWGEFAYVRDLDGNKLAIFHRERRGA